MNFKKRVNGSWTDTPYYIHTTSTDTITTLPAVLYPTGTTATVGLKGNTVQTGTPTHDNPITPQGTGERTGNLWDATKATKYYYTSIAEDNTWIYSTNLTGSVYRIPCKPNTTYTLYLAENVDITIWRIREVSTDVVPNATSTSVRTTGTYASSVPVSKSATFTTSASAKYILFQANESAYDSVLPVIMLIEGTTKIPYEKSGYKIPILSASTTTPVYLGEVETTRKIRGLVLTGEENWTLQSINSYGIANLWIILPAKFRNQDLGLSTHLTLQTTLIADTETEGFYLTSSDALYIRINATRVSTVTDFKAYLAQQYAAGTPVTVWYVLATPETAVVNEPLMRIGDYADTVNNITIPVTAGGDTLSVDTTVQPSEVSLGYTGWHDATVKEWDGSQWG